METGEHRQTSSAAAAALAGGVLSWASGGTAFVMRWTSERCTDGTASSIETAAFWVMVALVAVTPVVYVAARASAAGARSRRRARAGLALALANVPFWAVAFPYFALKSLGCGVL